MDLMKNITVPMPLFQKFTIVQCATSELGIATGTIKKVYYDYGSNKIMYLVNIANRFEVNLFEHEVFASAIEAVEEYSKYLNE